MLQNLSNKPTVSKESYMANLNPFVEANKARINAFLNDLCEVKDFYESLEMEQYVALSKKEIQLNIALNEIYTVQGLLWQHKEILVRTPFFLLHSFFSSDFLTLSSFFNSAQMILIIWEYV